MSKLSDNWHLLNACGFISLHRCPAKAGAMDAIEVEAPQVADPVQLELESWLLANGFDVRHAHKGLINRNVGHFEINRSGEGDERDEVEGWGREAIKAVGDADFQWRRHTSAAKSAQAAAAPGPLRWPRGSNTYFLNSMQDLIHSNYCYNSCI